MIVCLAAPSQLQHTLMHAMRAVREFAVKKVFTLLFLTMLAIPVGSNEIDLREAGVPTDLLGQLPAISVHPSLLFLGLALCALVMLRRQEP